MFDALTESACHACGAYDAVLMLRKAEFLQIMLAASYSADFLLVYYYYRFIQKKFGTFKSAFIFAIVLIHLLSRKAEGNGPMTP